MADHQAFATMLLRQIVGAHRALLQAEATAGPERARAIEAARQRLGELVRQASVQFPSAQPLPEGGGAAARH